MYIDIYPRSAGSDVWSTPSNALSDTGSGTCATYAGDPNDIVNPNLLYLYNFDTSNLPSNITLTGLEVHVKGFFNLGSGAGSAKITFGVDSSFESVSGSYNYIFSSSDNWTVLGGNFPIYQHWGYDLKYDQLKSSYFSINIAAINLVSPPSGGVYNVDACFVRVYYTASGYLTGSRSKFSYLNPVTDNISNVSNGVGLGYQVESEELNLVGDCLYNLEKAVITRLNQPILGVAGSVKHPHQYFYTITISGTVNSWVPHIQYEKGSQNYHNRFKVFSNTNLLNPKRSAPPYVSDFTRCRFVSGIAWVETATGNVGLYCSPGNFVIDPNSVGGTDYWLSVSAYGSTVIQSRSDVSVTTVLANQPLPYIGSNLTMAPVPPGIVWIKLLAIGIPGM